MPILIRFASLTPVLWRNGGGQTWEYAVHPPGAGFDEFLWRASRAEIRTDGPFSNFDGIDRTLTTLDGAALELETPTGLVRLDAASAPFSFPGELPVHGRPHHGISYDFNAMTRRGAWRHEVRRLTLAAGDTVPITANTHLLLAETPCTLSIANHQETLALADALLTHEPCTITLVAPPHARLLSVAYHACDVTVSR
jgi:environmental stress-induced protein Ves